jgi:hypothetical protein
MGKSTISPWLFIKGPRNREILSWLGGGLAMIVTALWVAITYFLPANATKDKTPNISCQHAICAGNDITDNKFHWNDNSKAPPSK